MIHPAALFDRQHEVADELCTVLQRDRGARLRGIQSLLQVSAGRKKIVCALTGATPLNTISTPKAQTHICWS